MNAQSLKRSAKNSKKVSKRLCGLTPKLEPRKASTICYKTTLLFWLLAVLYWKKTLIFTCMNGRLSHDGAGVCLVSTDFLVVLIFQSSTSRTMVKGDENNFVKNFLKFILHRKKNVQIHPFIT